MKMTSSTSPAGAEPVARQPHTGSGSFTATVEVLTGRGEVVIALTDRATGTVVRAAMSPGEARYVAEGLFAAADDAQSAHGPHSADQGGTQ